MMTPDEFAEEVERLNKARPLVQPTGAMPGKKWDGGKRRWDLALWEEIGASVDVQEHGAGKYGEWNWKGVARFEDRYFAAVMRHLIAWRNGEKTDPDSGHSHLAHAVCSIWFLMWRDRNG